MRNALRSVAIVSALWLTLPALAAAQANPASRAARSWRQQRSIAKTALGAETAVPWEHEAETAVAVASAAAAGYHVAAIETSPEAVDLYSWDPSWPVCLVFGHETVGVEPAVARRIDTHVRIPMLGVKRSLNVATAAGVVLYELLRRRLVHEGA